MTTPAQSAIGFPRAVDLARRDLQAIWDRLPTMHDEGWHPRQLDHDRPTPTFSPGAGPDDVPGPTWDCGQGDHRVRQGWQRMIDHLHDAEQLSTDVLCAAVSLQTRPVPPCRPTSLLDAQSSIRRLRERLTATQHLWERWSGNEPTATPTGNCPVASGYVDLPRAAWLARQLMGPRGNPEGSCFEHIRQAMFETQRVVREVGTGRPPPPCSKCKRISSIGQPRKGGLCHACYQERYRLKGRQRAATVRAARYKAG